MKPSSLGPSNKLHLSGFSITEKESLATKMSSLGLVVDKELTGSTNFLICKSNLVEKFRIAKILKIPVINSQWIQDSFEKKKLLDPNEYQFGVFQGLRFFLLGFPKKQVCAMAQVIISKGGRMFCILGNHIFLFYFWDHHTNKTFRFYNIKQVFLFLYRVDFSGSEQIF